MKQHDYLIYPSLLDAYARYLNTTAEDFFYMDEEGKWHRNLDEENDTYRFSEDEVSDIMKQEFIDTVNRVETEPSEAASKGTALNAIVDGFVSGKRDANVKMSGSQEEDRITGEVDGFTFNFSWNTCKALADYFKGSLCQVYTTADLETDFGIVGLYGYADYVRGDKVYDLKTTKSYTFGKYEDYAQRFAYPYTLIESGMVEGISSFEFTVCQLSGGSSRTPLITGKMYNEVYNYNHDYARSVLRGRCEQLIAFLEENRDLITNKKIFGYE